MPTFFDQRPFVRRPHSLHALSYITEMRMLLFSALIHLHDAAADRLVYFFGCAACAVGKNSAVCRLADEAFSARRVGALSCMPHVSGDGNKHKERSRNYQGKTNRRLARKLFVKDYRGECDRDKDAELIYRNNDACKTVLQRLIVAEP